MAKVASKVNADLDAVMKELLKDVKAKPKVDADGKLVEMSLTDKMKIIDRVLKWEAIKSKLNEEEWGKGFDT